MLVRVDGVCLIMQCNMSLHIDSCPLTPFWTVICHNKTTPGNEKSDAIAIFNAAITRQLKTRSGKHDAPSFFECHSQTQLLTLRYLIYIKPTSSGNVLECPSATIAKGVN